MTGAKETALAQAINTHNLANVNTTGFRASLQTFTSLPVSGPGYPSRVYAANGEGATDLSPGALVSTGRDLDVAVDGEGWIAVQARDGSEAYTRAGDLRLDATGRLTTGTGLAVLGNAGPIAIPPSQQLDFGSDGTITIVPLGQTADAPVVIDRIKLVNPAGTDLVKGSDGLMRLRTGEPAIPDARVRVRGGMLESSNVNGVESMVNLIELARQFELQVKLMRTAEENDQAAGQLLRMG
jgi:flagellar basal-body rod protein FlgF